MFAVVRNCCTSGNCFSCSGITPYGTPRRVEHWRGESEGTAKVMAENWRVYQAEVVENPLPRSVDWDHVQEVRDFVMRGLSKARECCVSCENHEKAWIRTLDTLLANRHPVATRETVERVAEVCMRARHPACFAWDYVTGEVKDEWRNIARAALTAAGFTLEAGA